MPLLSARGGATTAAFEICIMIALASLAATGPAANAAEPINDPAARASELPLDRFPELRAATATAALAGKALYLQADLWCDFMPISPPNGKPLAAVLRVVALDGSVVAPEVQAHAAWVVHGGTVWVVRTLERRNSPHVPGTQEWVARGGPKWNPGDLVDVIVRLRDGAGRVAFVIARDRRIARTD